MRYPSAEEWMKLVEEFRAGDLSLKEFVAKHDVSFHTCQYWIYRKSKKVQLESGSRPQFLPVTVVASAAPKARRREHDADELVEVAVHGVVCRFVVGTDTRYVAELIAALG